MHVCFADYYLSRHIDRREVSVWLHRLLGNLKADKQFRITGGRIRLKERTRDVVPDKSDICATSSHWNFWPDDLGLCCEQEICMWTCQSGHNAFGAQPWHSEVKRSTDDCRTDNGGVYSDISSYCHIRTRAELNRSGMFQTPEPSRRVGPALCLTAPPDKPAALNSVFRTCRR